MSVHFRDEAVTLLVGDAAAMASTLEPRSVQTVVTSPPYFRHRDYGVEGQLGAEPTPAEFITNLVAVFDAIRPALADNGTLWVNLGDSYSTYAGNRGQSTGIDSKRKADPWQDVPQGAGLSGDRPSKNLLGIPWRFAFAMQDAGWYLRNEIIWCKPNGKPESVTDRFTVKHEPIFLFSKKSRYYFDLDAVRKESVPKSGRTWEERKAQGAPGRHGQHGPAAYGDAGFASSEAGANPGDWWEIATQPFAEAHEAVFPTEIPRRCILAGSRPGDTVLDPFSGSGTTGLMAGKLGRRYVGIDLKAEYHDLALKTRLAQGALL